MSKVDKNEPMPKGNGTVVIDEVISDLSKRSEMGKNKYGTLLKTNNGRNSLMDLYQELLDACMYIKQKLMEEVVDDSCDLTFDVYQMRAMETAVYPVESEVVYPALGLNGEAGEVAEKVKKIIRDKNGDFSDYDDRMEIILELGDCLWYIAAIATNLGVTLDDVAYRNLEKLASRKERKKLHGNGDNR